MDLLIYAHWGLGKFSISAWIECRNGYVVQLTD